MTYQSRLLQNLDQQLRQCADRTERSRLISRRAIHLARLNQLDLAKAEIAQLRAELGTALDAGSGAWMLLAEGVNAYFSLDLDLSFDRLRRSVGIGKSAGITDSIPLATAWLAHINFHKGDYEQTAIFLSESLTLANELDHSSRCRAAMVASIFHGYAGQSNLARSWANIARTHANAEGDESSLAALLFNITIYRVSESRLANAMGIPLPDDYKMLIQELNSSLAFDNLADGSGLPQSPGLLRAHTYVIDKNFGLAIPIFQAALSNGVFSFNTATVTADLAFALASSGEVRLASDALEKTSISLSEAHDPDDLAFAHARMSETYRILGDVGSSKLSAEKAGAFFEEYRRLQISLRTLGESVPAPEAFGRQT